VGAQVGTVATKYIKGYGIRIAFGLAVVGCFLSIVLKLIAKAYKAPMFDHASTALVLSLVAVMSAYIFVKMLAGAKKEVAAKKGRA
jgi:undecaprenyl pyrophosphate phosphatase UppP